MENTPLGFLVLVLLVVNCLALLLSRDWRWSLAALGAQYLLAFFLVLVYWPLELAAVKLVGGWMATAILGMSYLNMAEQPDESAGFPRSRAFLGLAAGLVIIVVVGAAPALAAWGRQFTGIEAWGGLLLIGLGVIQVGLGSRIFRIILGLLTLLAGFEILYASVETSILVAGLLAIVNLGISLIGSYLLLAPGMEPRS
jgi:hypothetical protein